MDSIARRSFLLRTPRLVAFGLVVAACAPLAAAATPATLPSPTPTTVEVTVQHLWSSSVSSHEYLHARVTLTASRDADVVASDFQARVPSNAGFSRTLRPVYGAAPTATRTSLASYLGGAPPASPTPTVKTEEDLGALGQVSLTAGHAATIVITFDAGTSPAAVIEGTTVVYRSAR